MVDNARLTLLPATDGIVYVPAMGRTAETYLARLVGASESRTFISGALVWINGRGFCGFLLQWDDRDFSMQPIERASWGRVDGAAVANAPRKTGTRWDPYAGVAKDRWSDGVWSSRSHPSFDTDSDHGQRWLVCSSSLLTGRTAMEAMRKLVAYCAAREVK